MSRLVLTVLVGLSVLMFVGVVNAQQTMQPGQHQAQPGASTATPAWNSPQAVQNLSTEVDKTNADLQKAISTANDQVKGTAIGAAFTLRGPGSGSVAHTETGQGQNLVTHVYIVADNQLKDVIVDAKNDKVLNIQTRTMVEDPWAYREKMGAGGSTGQPGAESSTPGQTNQRGTLRERTGMPEHVSFLRLSTAQQITKLASQDNVTLDKVISACASSSQMKGAKAVGAFLVLPHQANTTGASSENLYAKVFALQNNQVKVATVDPKTDKILNVETRSTFIGPWQGRMGAGGSMEQPGSSGHKESQQQPKSGW